MRIYHCLRKSAWTQSCQKGEYRPQTLDSEGFIHCSRAEQIPGVLENHFPSCEGLVILEILQEAILSQVVYEDSCAEGQKFPHIYGPLNLDAVKRVFSLDQFLTPPWTQAVSSGTQKAPLVLFDIDSTLIRGSKAHKDAFRCAISEVFNLDGGIEDASVVHGRTDPCLLEEILLVRFQMDPGLFLSRLTQCQRAIIRYFLRLQAQDKIEVLEGVLELVNKLRSRGCILGLVTGNLELIAWEKLRSVGLDFCFMTGGFSSDFKEREKFLHQARLRVSSSTGLGIEARKTVLIGDAIQDMQAARVNDVEALGVTTGIYAQSELHEAGANWVVDSLTDSQRIMKIIGLD